MSVAEARTETRVREGSPLLRWALAGLAALVILWGAFALYMAGQPLFGAILLALAVAVAAIFGSARFYGARFILPGIAGVAIFILFPVLYTVWLGFTNYSSFNILDRERATEVLLSRGAPDEGSQQPFAVMPDDGAYRIWLPDTGLMSEPVALDGTEATVELAPGDPPAEGETLAMRDAIQLRGGLGAVTLVTPEGIPLVNAGLRTFASVIPEYERVEPGVLRRTSDGMILTASDEVGFYIDEQGRQVPPGWRVFVGADNFERIAESRGVREPMVTIFVWTVTFAFLSMVLTFGVGLGLAVVLQWEHLAFRGLYRVLLILPYAVPGFISILVFRGLFNQNFGEINLILGALFGISPEWFTNGFLARTMLLIVNTWLGYPYMMLLAMGFLQAVPSDHKKAAALEGASSVRVFFTITLPQIVPPMIPLLLSNFAFNFNNLVLILLLTRGLPDIPGTIIPAGQTDILASFTYRMSFIDSGQQFGLAGAITLLIFIVVAALSYANLVAMRRAARRRAG